MASHTDKSLRFNDFPGGIALDRDTPSLASFAADASRRVGAAPLGRATPKTADEVRKIVQWANGNGTPLIPVSSGDGPRRRGDTVAATPALVVDMSGMKKVIHIDGRDALAIIEPGVTFDEFDRALAPHGLRSFRPLAPRQSKSVLATFLEREPTTVPGRHWDSADPLAAMQLVFGDGKVFHTGGASLPGSLERNLELGNRPLVSVGPTHTDLGRVVQGAQGALAIVTWASVFCQRIPAAERPVFVAASQLRPLVDLAYRILRRRPGGQLFIVNNIQLSALFAESDAAIADLASAMPEWILYFEVSAADYFAEEAMAFQMADLERDAGELGLAVVQELAGIASSIVRERQNGQAGNTGAISASDSADVICLSQLDKVQGLLDQLDPADRAYAAAHVQPAVHGVNAQLHLILRAPGASQADLDACAVRVAEALAGAGAFFGRPYHPWSHVAFQRDKVIASQLAKVKKLFDPAGILQPGAQSLGGRP